MIVKEIKRIEGESDQDLLIRAHEEFDLLERPQDPNTAFYLIEKKDSITIEERPLSRTTW